VFGPERRDHLLDIEGSAVEVHGVRVADLERAGPKRGRHVGLRGRQAQERRVDVA